MCFKVLESEQTHFTKNGKCAIHGGINPKNAMVKQFDPEKNNHNHETQKRMEERMHYVRTDT